MDEQQTSTETFESQFAKLEWQRLDMLRRREAKLDGDRASWGLIWSLICVLLGLLLGWAIDFYGQG